MKLQRKSPLKEIKCDSEKEKSDSLSQQQADHTQDNLLAIGEFTKNLSEFSVITKEESWLQNQSHHENLEDIIKEEEHKEPAGEDEEVKEIQPYKQLFPHINPIIFQQKMAGYEDQGQDEDWERKSTDKKMGHEQGKALLPREKSQNCSSSSLNSAQDGVPDSLQESCIQFDRGVPCITIMKTSTLQIQQEEEDQENLKDLQLQNLQISEQLGTCKSKDSFPLDDLFTSEYNKLLTNDIHTIQSVSDASNLSEGEKIVKKSQDPQMEGSYFDKKSSTKASNLQEQEIENAKLQDYLNQTSLISNAERAVRIEDQNVIRKSPFIVMNKRHVTPGPVRPLKFVKMDQNSLRNIKNTQALQGSKRNCGLNEQIINDKIQEKRAIYEKHISLTSTQRMKRRGIALSQTPHETQLPYIRKDFLSSTTVQSPQLINNSFQKIKSPRKLGLKRITQREKVETTLEGRHKTAFSKKLSNPIKNFSTFDRLSPLGLNSFMEYRRFQGNDSTTDFDSSPPMSTKIKIQKLQKVSPAKEIESWQEELNVRARNIICHMQKRLLKDLAQ